MKNLKKVLAVMTAVTAMAASTSAFAADANTATVGGDITGTYADTDTTGTAPAYKLNITAITPAVVNEVAVTIDNEKDKTLLVLTEGALTAEDKEVSDEEILYIDQGTDAFTGLGLKDEIINTVTTEGKGHIIKVGYYDTNGNFYIANGTIAVTAPVVEEEGTEISFVWGDVNGDGSASATDANYIIKASAGGAAKPDDGKFNIASLVSGKVDGTDVSFVWGDVNGDGSASATDANYIIKASAGGAAKPDDGKFNIASLVTIIVPAE